ncbi:uncharacterized protein PHACADRAFT_259153 [Phanerochaete carnosa HHB-10118-sp]|uniref:DUF6534 domain-containing protein n=1 Tax=Phanerochaete carnosa (strain HHB-10118-sp) TaxID=650164 RepID=K5W259_PHACS|nr:uncharacterized protein PHACADRAFT_259153 [Phanerochaete carnosa HHB-10118-sp]EKM52979.1 hypothetical protein PHACADRAFT_259153 [Phanerochaete carnosa HHB-10118-sp]
MSATPSPPVISADMPPLDLNGTFGALLIGALVAAVLYGITVLQTVVYYQHSAAQDGWLVRAAVGSLWLVDTLDTALLSHIIYWYLVTNFGSSSALMKPLVWSMSAHLATTAVTEVVVRSMFSLRVWRLSGGKWLPALTVGIVTLLDLIFGIVLTVRSVGQTWFTLQKIQAFVFAQFATELLGDTLIALILCYYLYQSRTGFRRTDSVLTTLMAYVINTGLLTAMALTVNIVLFATERHNFAFVALYFVISKLYVNAYIAMLNARTGIRQKMGNVETIVPLSKFSDRSTMGISHASFGPRTSNPFIKETPEVVAPGGAEVVVDTLPVFYKRETVV